MEGGGGLSMLRGGGAHVEGGGGSYFIQEKLVEITQICAQL